eukprot:scaffold3563_cov139-Skeletonema_menzelii.AAC.5
MKWYRIVSIRLYYDLTEQQMDNIIISHLFGEARSRVLDQLYVSLGTISISLDRFSFPSLRPSGVRPSMLDTLLLSRAIENCIMVGTRSLPSSSLHAGNLKPYLALYWHLYFQGLIASALSLS